MPKKFPPEFKRDVVRVARRGDLTVPEVAIDFGVSEESVRRWVRQADRDDGITDGQTSTEQTELVQLRREPSWSSCAGTSGGWRWRTRSCVGLRRTSPRGRSQNDVPAGP